MLHVGFEDASCGRPLEGHGRPHPFRMKARKQRGVLTAVSRDFKEGSLAYGRVSIQRSEGGVGSHLVYERKPAGRIYAADLHAP